MRVIIHFSWKEKWPDICLYSDLWGRGNVFAQWSKTGKLVRKASEEEIGRQINPCGQRM